MTTPFSVAISAGGKSTRMGTDKALVDLNGKPVIERLLARVRDLGQAETILIANRPEAYTHLGLPTFPDALADTGSLGGIYTAILRSQQPYTLVLACDMPFVNPDLLRHMLSLRAGDQYDAIVPRVEGYPEGLHAVYSKACLPPIRRRLDADQLKVIGFYADVRVRYLDEKEWQSFDPDGISFYNVNTPDQLEQARRLAQAHHE
ncbi:MAG: molybdenum cofactor guanylyltransferase [Anaerolineae bacterium]|nr:molybdenum cofactor guanylyltransferase [Anaerolineae bacterium]